nr:MAG TPA: dUTPase [Caudoviricetes sp.]
MFDDFLKSLLTDASLLFDPGLTFLDTYSKEFSNYNTLVNLGNNKEKSEKFITDLREVSSNPESKFFDQIEEFLNKQYEEIKKTVPLKYIDMLTVEMYDGLKWIPNDIKEKMLISKLFTYNAILNVKFICIQYPEEIPEEWKAEKIDKGDWIDLRVMEDVDMKQGEFKYLDLGISISLPEGYEAILAPRSSTAAKHGILQANSIGIIDNSFSGPNDIWKFPAYAIRDTHIDRGTRICQFRIQKSMEKTVVIVEGKPEGKTDRGGLGSTGEK